MPRRLPPLNALKAFEAAARHLSFTRAAEELFVTQAAISHQIKALEGFLGLRLFRRKNRSLLLTEEGQGYFLDIKDIFAAIAEATDKLVARGAKGALTVAMQPSFAIQWLVPRLMEFSQRHPEIDVRIKALDQDEGTLSDDVDVAIYYGQGNWPGLRCDKLHTEFLVPVCSPRLLEERPLRTPADLASHTLLHDGSCQAWLEWFQQLELAVPNLRQGPIFSHSSMVLQAAVLGQGVALGHSVLAQPELEAGRLVCPLEPVLVSRNAYYLVCQAAQAEQGRIAAFRNWMLERVSQEESRPVPLGKQS